jgi:hypothetical protein
MHAAVSSVTPVPVYQTTLRHISEDRNLRIQRAWPNETAIRNVIPILRSVREQQKIYDCTISLTEYQ